MSSEDDEDDQEYKPGDDRDNDEDDAKSVGDQEKEEKDAARMKEVFGDEDADEDDNQDSKPSRLSRPSEDTDSELEESSRKTKGKRSKSSSKSEKSSKKRRSARDASDHDEQEGKKSKKGKNTFLDSDDEEAHIQAGDVIDLDTEQVVKSDGKRKISKREKEEIMRREKENLRKFVDKLRNAAIDDKDAYSKGQMATKKMQLLDQLVTELTNKNKIEGYLECGVLKAIRLWLDPLDPKKKAASLPNKTLITKVLEVLDHIPVDDEPRFPGTGGEQNSSLDLIADSQVGVAVSYVKHVMKANKSCPVYRLADKIKEKWYRVIYDKSDDLRKEKEDAKTAFVPKPNRDWERMPESVNNEGTKATKGEYGFRYGASVPRPMLMAFSKRPESKVVLEDALEKMKESKNDYRDRLSKISQDLKRRSTEGSSKAAVPEINRIIVGGVASKVTSMGWADADRSKKKKAT